MGNKISRRRDTAPAEQKAAEEAIDTQEAVVEAVADAPVVVTEVTEPVVESVPAPVQEAEPEPPKQPETEPSLEELVSVPLVAPAPPEPEPLVSVSKPVPVVPEPKPVVPEPKPVVPEPKPVVPVPKPVVPEPKPVVPEPKPVVIEQEAVPEPNLSQEFLLQPVIPEPFPSPAPLLDLGVPELTPEPLDAPPSHRSAPDQPTDLGGAECYDDKVKAAWNSVSVPEKSKETLEKPATMAEKLLCDVMGSELSKADSSTT
ncbi:protein TsetseEP-like [Oncorhynchus clarkii lewisi]|uniref:protein TsetseEP-like n=1 Tax=Oncorhynchus clarkii lewisi TaxID=490388 RepID=UPI0039B87FCA